MPGGLFAPFLLAVSAFAAPASEPSPAPAATPAAQGVVLDRIEAVVGDDLILESEVKIWS